MTTVLGGGAWFKRAGDDTLTQNDGWRYAAWIAVASVVSRGLAKLGVREPYTDDDR